jgi:phage terminase large subunit GpA-like protein
MGALEFALPFADIDADAARELRPRPLTTVSAWSDKYRILTSKGSGEPGQWRTDRTPYLREILDALSVNSPAQRIVLMFAAQLGKTEVGLNWIGYVMQHAPGPMLTVLPTLEVRKRWVRQRLDPLLTETPVIRALFDARRARDAGNAEDMKDFPGGMLVIGGANSPASLASMPIRYVLCDEVDRFPWEVGQEGDPARPHRRAHQDLPPAQGAAGVHAHGEGRLAHRGRVREVRHAPVPRALSPLRRTAGAALAP